MRFLLVCCGYGSSSYACYQTTVTGESLETVRFATHLVLDSCGAVVANWNRYNCLRTKRLYRADRPAVVIVSLLLASGDIESNPGPVYQYPCTVCLKPVKRNQRGIACDGCDKWTHAQCGNVGEAEYLLLTSQEGSEWFSPVAKGRTRHYYSAQAGAARSRATGSGAGGARAGGDKNQGPSAGRCTGGPALHCTPGALPGEEGQARAFHCASVPGALPGEEGRARGDHS